MHKYAAYGLSLESEFELSELIETQGTPTCDPDPVTVIIGDVPHDLPNAITTVEGYRVTAEQALFVMEGTARYLICGGKTITVAPEAGHEPAWLRIVLLSGALGILLHQRGLFPLHASAVVDNGVCIAFGGNSGAGKSTLAAGLSHRGFRLLAEDKLVLRKTVGDWVAWPGVPFLHLFEESASRGGLGAQTQGSPSPRAGKFIHFDADRFERQSKPLKALYMVDWLVDGDRPTITPITAMQAFLELRTHSSLNGLIPAMGREAAFMPWAIDLLKDIPIYRFSRPQDYDKFGEGLDFLQAHWMSLSSD